MFARSVPDFHDRKIVHLTLAYVMTSAFYHSQNKT